MVSKSTSAFKISIRFLKRYKIAQPHFTVAVPTSALLLPQTPLPPPPHHLPAFYVPKDPLQRYLVCCLLPNRTFSEDRQRLRLDRSTARYIYRENKI